MPVVPTSPSMKTLGLAQRADEVRKTVVVDEKADTAGAERRVRAVMEIFIMSKCNNNRGSSKREVRSVKRDQVV